MKRSERVEKSVPGEVCRLRFVTSGAVTPGKNQRVIAEARWACSLNAGFEL